MHELPDNSIAVVIYVNDAGEMDAGLIVSKRMDAPAEVFEEVETFGYGCLSAVLTDDPVVRSLGTAFVQGKNFGERYIIEAQAALAEQAENKQETDEQLDTQATDASENSSQENVVSFSPKNSPKKKLH